MKKLLLTLAVLCLTGFIHADYIVVWKPDGSQIKSFDNPTAEQIARMACLGYGYKVFADKDAADAVTQQEIDDAIVEAVDNQKDITLHQDKLLIALAKTIAQLHGMTPVEFKAAVKANY